MPRLAPVTSATWPASSSLNLLILSDNPFGQQRKLILQRMLVEIGQRGRIGAREAGVAILRTIVVALRFAERAVEAVDGQESQAVGIDELPHLADGHLRRAQFGAFWRADAIEPPRLRCRARDRPIPTAPARLPRTSPAYLS